ncbi:acetyl-CoA carboxylase 1-like [Tachypleus tridentatus]|uniref:acetyl-CoA carboxylase 1-like n=1 Tax=Tachypleus tridentatus TaxID=6853 RepID=UPI003FD32835
MYHQVALTFADLHDTPTRMQEKGVIQDIIPWNKSRTTLYWRLRRLLLQGRLKADILKVKPSLGDGKIEAMFRRWFIEEHGQVNQFLWDDNKAVVEWLASQLNSAKGHSAVMDNIHCLKRDAVICQIRSLIHEYPEVAMDSAVHIIQHMTPQQRADILNTMKTLDSQLSDKIGSISSDS